MNCAWCNTEFEPKPMGYNARYCAEKCKLASKRKRIRTYKPQQLVDARRRGYETIKASPERLGRHRAAGRKFRRAVREWLAEYKLSVGCVDCGYRGHSAALQLDHEGPKSIDIADARSSIKRLQAEIESGDCKVRCANCHSIRTWQQKQNTAPGQGINRKGV